MLSTVYFAVLDKSVPIYFWLFIWVLLSGGPEPTPQAYFERGALFYNAFTQQQHLLAKMGHSTGRRTLSVKSTLSDTSARTDLPSRSQVTFLSISAHRCTPG